MARKGRKKRRGLWGWLMGHEAPATAPPARRGAAETVTPEAAAPAPIGQGRPAGPCSICGGTEFRWGWLETGLYGLGKGPSAVQMSRWVKRKTRFGEFLGLQARLCVNCGHVDAFAGKAPAEEDENTRTDPG